MSINGYKRLTVVLSITCLGLLVWCGFLFWSHAWLRVQVAFAMEQAQIFEDMRAKALQSDPAVAAGCLEYVVWYYPSGTKQPAGSRLDRMVKRERERAVGDIFAHLRARTGDDLGESPSAWIQKYSAR